MSDHRTECAIYLAQGPELRIVWANEPYHSLLSEPIRSSNVIGMRLDEISPLAPLRSQVLCAVIENGEPQSGEDRRFSVEDGTLVLNWTAYRPIEGHVLVSIRIRHAGDDDTASLR